MSVCVQKTKEPCFLGACMFQGNCTTESTGTEKSGNNEREGEQREMLMFEKEVEHLNIEDQAQTPTKTQTYLQG